jgi:amino-acid N-acetyltransferase
MNGEQRVISQLTAMPVSVRPIVICKPTVDDVAGLVDLVNRYARQGDLLPRTPGAIRTTLSDWVIGKQGDEVVACGSLLMYTAVLAEVRSLAVADQAQGMGIGHQIVEALIAEARQRHIPTLFALTRAVPFFQRLGFSITEKEFFPQKVWNDCVICPLKDHCDEVAVVLSVNEKQEATSR